MSENETKSAVLDDASLEGVAGGANGAPDGQTYSIPADKTWKCQHCNKTWDAASKPSRCIFCGSGDRIVEMISQRTIKI